MIVLEEEHQQTVLATSTQQPSPSSFVLMRRIAGLGCFMSASDTYAIKGMLLPLLLSRINSDPEHLAAITLIITTTNIVVIGVSQIFALNMLAPPLIAQYNTLNGNPEEQATKIRELNILYRNGLIYSAFAFPSIMLVLNFSEPMFTSIFQQNAAVARIAAEFLRPYSIAVPATFFYLTTLMMLQSFQYTRALAIGTASMVLCLALSIGLGYGTDLGIEGVLIGHVAEPFLTSIAFGGFLFGHPKFRDFHFFTSLTSSLRGNLTHMKQLLSTGSVITINVAAEIALGFGLAALTGVHSLKAQESLALIMQYTLANAILGVHFPLSGMIIMGDAMGSPDKKAVYKTAKAGLLVALLAGSIIPLVFGVAPRSLLSIFGKEDDEIAGILDVLAPIMSIGSLVDVLRVAFVFQLRMLGDMKGSTAINVFSQLSGLGLAFGLGLYTNLDIYGIGLGYSLSIVISCAVLAQRWYSKMEPYRQPEPVQNSRPSLGWDFCFWKSKTTSADAIPLQQLEATL